VSVQRDEQAGARLGAHFRKSGLLPDDPQYGLTVSARW
jgi:hypothetical protein